MPFPEGGGLNGTWFVIGWPLPTLELKVGGGIYYEFSFISLLFSLINISLWLAVYFGVLKLVEKYFLPDWLLYPGVIIFFSLNVLGFFFLGFYFLCCFFLG